MFYTFFCSSNPSTRYGRKTLFDKLDLSIFNVYKVEFRGSRMFDYPEKWYKGIRCHGRGFNDYFFSKSATNHIY